MGGTSVEGPSSVQSPSAAAEDASSSGSHQWPPAAGNGDPGGKPGDKPDGNRHSRDVVRALTRAGLAEGRLSDSDADGGSTEDNTDRDTLGTGSGGDSSESELDINY